MAGAISTNTKLEKSKDLNESIDPSALPSSIQKPDSVKAEEILARANLPKPKSAPEIAYGVHYGSSKNINDIYDLMDNIRTQLGPGVAKDLAIVRMKSGEFGLVYERNGDASSTADIAKKHSDILDKTQLLAANSVSSSSYTYLYNISFGVSPNFDSLKQQFEKIAGVLGTDIKDKLFIERRGDDQFALIYKRLTNIETAQERAENYSKLLQGHGISASFTRERNNDLVFGNSSYVGEKEVDPSLSKQARTGNDIERERMKPKTTGTSESVENQVEKFITSLRQTGQLTKDEKVSFSAYDFRTGEKILSVNEDAPRQGASMIKPYVALAFFHEVEKGNFKYGPNSKHHMEEMIQHSDNDSTNWLIRELGGPKRVQQILQENYSRMLQETKIVEEIPHGGQTYKNSSSAHDYSRFLYALWNNSLPHSEELRRLMALPGNDRIRDRADLPESTTVYNKTGTTARVCGDMGIIIAQNKSGEQFPYTMIGIVENGERVRNYSEWQNKCGNIIGNVSNIVYKALESRHNIRNE